MSEPRISSDLTVVGTQPAETLEEPRSKLIDLVPELLAENDPSADRSSLPVEIVATQHLLIDAA